MAAPHYKCWLSSALHRALVLHSNSTIWCIPILISNWICNFIHWWVRYIMIQHVNPFMLISFPSIRPPKSLRFLVISRLQNRCSNALFKVFFLLCFCLVIFFFCLREIRDTCLRGDQISHDKVWWLREAPQIGQTFIMWKSRLKHSTAEFQSIQQFWVQFDIVSQQKKGRRAGLVCGDAPADTRNLRLFLWPKMYLLSKRALI